MARYCHDPFDQRESGFEHLGNRGYRGHILYYGADVHRELAGWDFPIEERLDQHLLRSLRVLDRERTHGDVEIRRPGRLDRGNGIRFVLLDPDHGATHPETPHHDADPEMDPFRVFDHGTVVGGEVRFAFAPVDHNHVDGLILGRSELDMGREGGAAQTHQPGFLHRLDQFLGRQALPIGDDPLAGSLGREGLDRNPDGGRIRPVRMRPQ